MANNDSNDRHNNQQTMRAKDYETMVFDGSGGQGQRWCWLCLMAAAMDNKEALARQQRQRGGRNNQMKMTFDSGGGQGQSTVVAMENGKAAEHSTAAAMDNNKAMA